MLTEYDKLPNLTCQVDNGTGWVYKIKNGTGYIMTAGHVLGKETEQPYGKPVNIKFENQNPLIKKQDSEIHCVIRSLNLSDNDKGLIFDCAVLKCDYFRIDTPIEDLDLVECKYKEQDIREGQVRIYGYPIQPQPRRGKWVITQGNPKQPVPYNGETFFLLQLSGEHAKVEKGYSGSAVYSTPSVGIIGVLVEAEGKFSTESRVVPLYQIHKWLQEEKDKVTQEIKKQQETCDSSYAEVEKKKQEIDEIYKRFKIVNFPGTDNLLQKFVDFINELEDILQSIKEKNKKLSRLIDELQHDVELFNDKRKEQIDIINAQFEDTSNFDVPDNNWLSKPIDWIQEAEKWEEEIEKAYNNVNVFRWAEGKIKDNSEQLGENLEDKIKKYLEQLKSDLELKIDTTSGQLESKIESALQQQRQYSLYIMVSSFASAFILAYAASIGLSEIWSKLGPLGVVVIVVVTILLILSNWLVAKYGK